jgi:hypothetical protein
MKTKSDNRGGRQVMKLVMATGGVSGSIGDIDYFKFVKQCLQSRALTAGNDLTNLERLEFAVSLSPSTGEGHQQSVRHENNGIPFVGCMSRASPPKSFCHGDIPDAQLSTINARQILLVCACIPN